MITEDRLLGGRVVLRQPEDGLRAAIDPVLLAAAVPARRGERVLDLGAGTGAATFCLAARVPDTRLIGLELQRDLVRLAVENSILNDVEHRVTMVQGDVIDLPPRLAPSSVDHVMANPPFIEAGTGTAPQTESKAIATGEGSVDLSAWVRTALALVRPGGSVSIIHRADRLDALLSAFTGRAGEIVVFPLWPGAGKPAKRVIVRARRDVRTPLRLAAGMILHEADGRYTDAAEAVLRDAQPLAL